MITHLGQEKTEKNIFILTPERANLTEVGALDFFVIDEFYKIQEVTQNKTGTPYSNKLCIGYCSAKFLSLCSARTLKASLPSWLRDVNYAGPTIRQ